MAATVGRDDLVLLLGPDGERFLASASTGPQQIPGLGVIQGSTLLGKAWGEAIPLGLRTYRVLRPVLSDHLRTLERRAQIITPKDAARILLETGLGAGNRVAEAGAGSGAVTVVLAHAVAPNGRVYAYDNRPEHLEVARANVRRARLEAVVEFRVGDVRQDLVERELDAVVLDVPDPEAAIPAAYTALRPGGVLAVYAPLVEQAARAVQAANVGGFVDTRTLELIERGWTLHERGARPDFDMLGHTGFLTFCRRGA